MIKVFAGAGGDGDDCDYFMIFYAGGDVDACIRDNDAHF